MPHIPAPFPPDEATRIAALERAAVLDTVPEAAYDDVVALASAICETPIGLVSLVDRERQWFKACIGLDTRETHRDLAFCAHAILQPDTLLIVEDATQDPRFNQSPLVLGSPHIRFYAGAPVVTSSGQALGTVCVIDTVTRSLTDRQCDALKALARQTAAMLELRQLSQQQTAQAQVLRRRVTDALVSDDETHARLRQQQRVASVGQLTSGIAHDFNNLLQSINVSLQLIDRKADSPDQVRRWAASGLQTVTRGAQLIGQLLAISRDQAPELRALCVGERVNDMQTLLASALGPRIRLHFDLADAGTLVNCDGTQLEAAVLNLAINARDAMEHAGAIRIATRVREVRGDLELPDGQYVELDVCDDGPGMPPAVAKRAFEPFFTTKGEGKGTGLGLSQVYGFSLKAGGIARIHAAPEGGTRLCLTLKAVSTEGRPVAKPGAVHAVDTPVALGVKILLIDDDRNIQHMLGELLSDAGYDVRTVNNGIDALHALERDMPHVVVTDYAMQGLSGAALARVMHEIHPGLPLIFMTGQADIDAVSAKLGPGVDLLKKPLLLEEVAATVQRVVARRWSPPRR